jgi:adhesin transport system membrane fusion protein
VSNLNFQTLAKEMSGKQSLGNSSILFAIFAFVFVIFSWASIAELDNVTRGQGHIVSSVQNQMVQAGEGGIILRRYVSENSAVAKGDILFEIDPVDSASELNRLEEKRAALKIKEARLRAEIEGGEFIISEALKEASPIVAATEESLFSARKTELAGALSVLAQQENQRRQDLDGAQAARDSADRTMKLIQKEITVLEPMVKQNIAPETRLLELQREMENARGHFDAGTVAIAQAQSGINGAEEEMKNRKDAYSLQAMGELSDVVAGISELDQSLPLLKERVSRTIIRAPMDGIVYRLNYRTLGGYVKTGDVVLELVPTGEDLIVDTKVEPKDISTIKLGDAVRIQLSAYESSRYGSLDGQVTRISPDAIINKDNGSSYYQVDVAIESKMKLLDGSIVTLMPGMTATVDVLTGKRTILAYLWQPVVKIQELALRD